MDNWICIIVCWLSAVPLISSNGKFYVGFLGYKNSGNLGYDGQCCDGETDASGHCMDTCDLIFQVSAYGLDRGNITNKRPSRRPINDTNSFMFSDEYKHAINPISFDFKKWPGLVQVVVQVFDQDMDLVSSNRTLEAVDEMHYNVTLHESSEHFLYQNISGLRAVSPSVIMLLFRYNCDTTYYGDDCLTDCLMNPTNPLCPRTTRASVATTLPTEPITDCSSSTDVVTETYTPATSPASTEQATSSKPRPPSTSSSISAQLGSSDTPSRGRSSTSQGPSTPSQDTSTPSPDTSFPSPGTITPSRDTSTPPTDTTTSLTSPDTSTRSSDTSSPSPGNAPSAGKTTPSIARRTSLTPPGTSTSLPTPDTGTSPPGTIHSTTNVNTLSTYPNASSPQTSTPSPGSSTSLLKTSSLPGDTITTSKHQATSASTIKTSTLEPSTVSSTSPTGSVTSTGEGPSSVSSITGNKPTSSNHPSSQKPSVKPSTSTTTPLSSPLFPTTSKEQTKARTRASVSPSHSTRNSSGITTKDPKDFALKSNSDNTWEIVLGCVLGGVALIAIIVFLAYHNRQKTLLKRQEIYNVSPEVISIVEENGATERSDVPITTSPL